MNAGVIRTPVGTAPVLPVLIMSVGAYLAWFGVHYWRSDTAWPSDPIKAVLQGKPIPVADRSAIEDALSAVAESSSASSAGAGVISGPVGSATGDRIAAAAGRYTGAGYVFGGRAEAPGDWDCSSFVSYVLGHDLGLPLPGGKWGDPGYPPHAHGPTTVQYLMYGKPIARRSAARGDLIVSGEHMGIVVGQDSYISARTPALGTGVGSYASHFPGGSPVFRRVV